MNTVVVQAPASLLLDPELTASAKLVWMICRLHGPLGPAQLQAHSGLSRPTILTGLARLAATGWRVAPSADPEQGPRGAIPADLLADRRVGAQGRVLYGILQVIPAFRNQTGQFSYAELSTLTHANPKTLKRAVRDLADTGWLKVAQANQNAPVRFSIRNPVTARREGEVERARLRLDEAPYLGEALMREYLSLLIDSDDFEDDAAPGFLVNPLTDERMELDRFYPPAVAFEFNGPQHYGATGRFSAEDAARQRGRDYMKLGICVEKGITLLIIHPEDLTLESMRQRIGPLLPMRDLAGQEPLMEFLKSISRRYRAAARRGN